MMSKEQNDLITRIGPGRPAGDVLRRYWMPAALTKELEANRPVIPVRLLGEDLALFRDGDTGKLGLVGRHCPHRGADMCYGRVEDGGIRCVFHGWLYGANGQCLEQPGEPAGSTMHERIKIKSYPVEERNGIVWAYMGPGEAPPFPAFDCFVAPESHVFAFKGWWECNWLQALEVGIDPAHASFLHRFLEDEDTSDSYGKQFRGEAADTKKPLTQLLRENPAPELQVEETDYGLRIIALRDLPDGQRHVRVTNQVFPCAIHIPMSNDMTITQWHVPIDDENCYWYAMFTSFGDPVDKEKMWEQRIKEHTLPDYRPIRNKGNEYGFDPAEQATVTYTGMGMDINVHDQWACESMGPIQDRTDEHLSTTDAAIVRYRRMLRAAIKKLSENQDDLPMNVTPEQAAEITGPIALDAVAPQDEWEDVWLDRDASRREASPWKVAS